MTTEPEITAIVRHKSDAIIPTTFQEAEQFAAKLATSALVPEKLRQRAPDVLFMVLAGRELGLTPIASLRLMHVIEGTPKPSADGLAAIVVASPVCEYLEPVEITPESATWEAKRIGRPARRRTWTRKDAETAKLWGRTNRDGSPSPWVRFPGRMLSARAKAELCRDVFPEICAGLYVTEEHDDGAPEGPPQFTAPTPPAAEPAKPGRKSSKAAPAATPPNGAAPGLGFAPQPAEPIEDAEIVDEAPPAAKEAAPAPDPTPAATVAPASSSATSPPVSGGTGNGSAPAPGEAFGDDAPAKTIEAFEALVSAARSLPDLAQLKSGEWLAWSKAEGKPQAARMRTAFAQRQKEIEAATGGAK